MGIIHFLAGAAAGYWYGSRQAAAATTGSDAPDPSYDPAPGTGIEPDPYPSPQINVPTGASTYAPQVNIPHRPSPDISAKAAQKTMKGLMDPWIEPAYFNLARPYARGVELSAYRDPLRRELPHIPRIRRAWLPTR